MKSLRVGGLDANGFCDPPSLPSDIIGSQLPEDGHLLTPKLVLALAKGEPTR